MLKRIDFSKDHFIANDKKYVISQEMSINRWFEYQKLQLEVGFGMSFSDMYNNLDKSIKFGNSGKSI